MVLRRIGLRDQRGQAMVMTLIFGVVMVLVTLLIFRSGRLTIDKMEMQNAADASAYSVSVIEARDLNFASYMNRAVVANEVAIGQGIGLASWALHFYSIGDWINEYNQYLSGPTLGISNTFLPPIASVFYAVGSVGKAMFIPYARLMTAVNTNVNMAYEIGALIHHVATIVASIGVLNDVVEDNAPDGARMSNFGMLSFIGHLASYNLNFTNSFSPTKYSDNSDFQTDTVGETDAGGYGRLAATIRESGDPFTKGEHNPQYNPESWKNGRGWDFSLFEQLAMIPGNPLPINESVTVPVLGSGSFGVDIVDGNLRLDAGISQSFKINFGIGEVAAGYSMDAYLIFGVGMERQGSSEIRMVVPLTGTKSDKAAGEAFNWSSADATSAYFTLGAGFAFDAYAYIKVLGAKLGAEGSASADALLDGATEELTLKATLALKINTPLGDITVDIPISICDTCPFPASLPISTGFAQAASSQNLIATAPGHMGVDGGNALPPILEGPITDQHYGGAPNRVMAWGYPPKGTAMGIYYHPTTKQTETKVATNYRGLPNYLDTNDLDTTSAQAIYGAGAPFLITGISLSDSEFENRTSNIGRNNQDANFDATTASYLEGESDPFYLNDDFSSSKMSTIAKSEVYFKRPLDISQFARTDGYVEHGSAFNPYWQARLVETSHADRVAALLIEHGEIAQGGASGDLANTVTDVLAFLLNIAPDLF